MHYLDKQVFRVIFARNKAGHPESFGRGRLLRALPDGTHRYRPGCFGKRQHCVNTLLSFPHGAAEPMAGGGVQTQTPVIVHSSWRQHFSDPELRQLLQDLGARMLCSAQGPSKAVAIESVMRANLGCFKDYVVLDDDARLAAVQGLNVIQCDSKLGLSSPATQEELARWLRGS